MSKKEKVPFMQWVLNSPDALKAVLWTAIIVPVILIPVFIILCVINGWWVVLAITAVVVYFTRNNYKLVIDLLRLNHDKSINQLVFEKTGGKK